MHKRRSKNTRGIFIQDEKIGYYLVDDDKIIGEARGYNPYSRFGEVMFYEIDVFGFIAGYIHDNWIVMSEIDLRSDRVLSRELDRVLYDTWKRHNIADLLEEYGRVCHNYQDNFDMFCKARYETASNA